MLYIPGKITQLLIKMKSAELYFAVLSLCTFKAFPNREVARIPQPLPNLHKAAQRLHVPVKNLKGSLKLSNRGKPPANHTKLKLPEERMLSCWQPSLPLLGTEHTLSKFI